MDYNMEDFFRMQQAGGYKMPFYMTYPAQSLYMTEMEYERDREYMKDMYPKEARKIQDVVEDECDKLEYEGSFMFDEYPDKVMLRRMCEKIYQRVYAQQADQQDVEATQYRPGCPGPNCGPGPVIPGRPGRPVPPPPPGNWGRNLIEVLLYDEMYRRRCRHGRCRRWW